jgi:hypothetical protein
MVETWVARRHLGEEGGMACPKLFIWTAVLATIVSSGVAFADQATLTATAAAIRPDGRSSIFVAALGSDNLVHYQYSGQGGDCTFSGAIGLPQSGIITGLDTWVDKSVACYSVPQPTIALSYADGKTFLAVGTHKECDSIPYCDAPLGWSLCADFGFSGGLAGIAVSDHEDNPGLVAWDDAAARTAHVTYSLTRAADVRVNVYSVDGRLVRNLLDARAGIGSATIEWDHRDNIGALVAPGVYFIECCTSASKTVVRLMLLQ